MAKTPSHVSHRELGALVNNAVFSARRTLYFVELEDKLGVKKAEGRMDRLRAYTEGHISTLKEHLNEGIMNPDEAILVLLSEALLVFGLYCKNVKLPLFADLASRLATDPPLPAVVDLEDAAHDNGPWEGDPGA